MKWRHPGDKRWKLKPKIYYKAKEKEARVFAKCRQNNERIPNDLPNVEPRQEIKLVAGSWKTMKKEKVI